MDKELLESINKLDANAKLILKHSLLIYLGVLVEQEKKTLKIIELLWEKLNVKMSVYRLRQNGKIHQNL